MDWFLVLGVVGAIWAAVVLTWRPDAGRPDMGQPEVVRSEEGQRHGRRLQQPIWQTEQARSPRFVTQSGTQRFTGATMRPGGQAWIYGYGEDDRPPTTAERRAVRQADQTSFNPLAGAGHSQPSVAAQRATLFEAARSALQPESHTSEVLIPAAAQSRLGVGDWALNHQSKLDESAQELPLAEPQRARSDDGRGQQAIRAKILPVRISDYQPGEQVIIRYTPTHLEAPAPRLTAHQVGQDVELRLSGTTVAILERQRARRLIDEGLLQLSRDEPDPSAGHTRA